MTDKQFYKKVNRETALIINSFVGVLVFGTIGAFIFSGASEISASQYTKVMEIYTDVPSMRKEEHWDDNKISHWEYTRIVRAYETYNRNAVREMMK